MRPTGRILHCPTIKQKMWRCVPITVGAPNAKQKERKSNIAARSDGPSLKEGKKNCHSSLVSKSTVSLSTVFERQPT